MRVGVGVCAGAGVDVGNVGAGRGVLVVAGGFVGVGGVGVDTGDCEVVVGIVRAAGCVGAVGLAVEVGVWASAPRTTGVPVSIDLRVRTGASSARRELILPHTYDDMEQQEQIMQPMKNRITCSSSQETGNPSPMGRWSLEVRDWRSGI